MVRQNSCAGLIAFLLLLVAPASSQDSGSQATEGAQNHPTVQDVLRRYIKALGGMENLKTRRNLRIYDKIICTDKNGEHDQDATLFVSGFKHLKLQDGKKTWYLDSSSQPFCDLTKGQTSRRLPVDYRHPSAWPLFIAAYPGKLTYDENRSLETGDHVLAAAPIFKKPTPNHADVSPKEFVFDKKTGLLKSMKRIFMVHRFRDYRKVDDIMVPHEVFIEVKVADIDATYKQTIIEYDSDFKIDADLFKVPKEYLVNKND